MTASTNGISLNGTIITVDNTLPLGTYYLMLNISALDLPVPLYYPFSISIQYPNTAPYLLSTLIDQSVKVDQFVIYTLPGAKGDQGDKISISAFYNTNQALPSFIKFLTIQFMIYPQLNSL